MQTLLVLLHLFLAIGLIGLVLIQHGKGADAGAAFGGGSSGTVFGAQGSGSFLTKATGFLAGVFFLTSLTLAWYAMQTTDQPGLMGALGTTPQPSLETPAAPVSEVPLLAPETMTREEVPKIPIFEVPVLAPETMTREEVPKIPE